MAKLFNITLPAENTSLKLHPKQRATVTYTVTNLTGRPVRGRAVLKPDDPAVKNKWVTLAGETEKDFDEKSSTFQFPVNVNVPAGAAPGKYTFRLDAVNADMTDEGDPGLTVGLEIVAEQKAKMSGWVIPVIVVVVLAVAGGITLLLMSSKKTSGPVIATTSPTPTTTPTTTIMPDLIGKDLTDAHSQLMKLNLHVRITAATPSSAEQANKVMSQVPAKDTPVNPERITVWLTIGANLVRVPPVVGRSIEEAQLMLSAAHFYTVHSTTQSVKNVNPGFVSTQDPDGGQDVLPSTTINLVVADQLKTVPNVKGMTFAKAVLAIRKAGLEYGNVFGTQIEGTVISQDPLENSSVQAGTRVNLTVPGCARPGPSCFIDHNYTAVYLMKSPAFNQEIMNAVQNFKITLPPLNK